MTFEEFQDFVKQTCCYDAIYDDQEGRRIIVMTLLDAYSMLNKQKKEWVGLTNEEIDQCFEQCVIKNFNEDGTEQSIVSTYQAGQAIEDKLKEKNGG